tara:strand:+ start:754 stop:1755 length:1002 start_codon:yes stop_codon:yes gene_type:complete
MVSKLGGFALAGMMALAACSGGSTADMDPAEARAKLTEQGLAVTQDGLRGAVDMNDADAVGMYVATGFDRADLIDALSYAPTVPGDSNNPKLPGPIEANYADPAYRDMLQVMFDAGVSPSDTLFANDNQGRGFSNFNTSLIAEALRIGDQDFLDFLAKQDADWTAPPRCYGDNPRCAKLGTLSSWLFYIPTKAGNVWSMDDSIAALKKLREMGLGYDDAQAQGEGQAAGDWADPYLKAILAYHHTLWSPDDARIAALWREAGSPQPILAEGWDIEAEKQGPADARRDRAMEKWDNLGDLTRKGRQRTYLREAVYACLAERGYEACRANPPAVD